MMCQQESSEDSELRAAIAASITDTHFKPVCYNISGSETDDNDTDVSEIADDEEPAHSGSSTVKPDADSGKKWSTDTSSTLASEKLRVETTLQENSANTNNCVGSLHDSTKVESLVSHGDQPVCTVVEKASSWKDFLGPESGNSYLSIPYVVKAVNAG